MEKLSDRVDSISDRNNSALIRDQLQRIVQSAIFVRAERLQRFLRFIVEASLSHESESLKEYTIGVQVYDRRAEYDPKTEPIVRNEARRLRSKLEEYYETVGRNDRVVIKVPAGGYVPDVEIRPAKLVSIQPVAVPIPQQPDSPPRPSSRIAWIIVTVLTAVLVTGSVWLFSPRKPKIVPRLSSIARYAGYQFQPSLSPEGKQVAFVWDEGTGTDNIYVKLISVEAKLRLTSDPEHDVSPAWSPDGTKVAFLRVGPDKKEILTVPSLGGQEHLLCRINAAQPGWVNDASVMVEAHSPGPVWSPDGHFLAITDRPDTPSRDRKWEPDSIYFVSVEGGEKKKITSPDQSANGDYFPAFSPNGRWLAFKRETRQRDLGGIYVQQLDGGAVHQITSGPEVISGLTWVSEDRLVYSSDRTGRWQLWTISRDGGAPEVLDVAGRNALQPNASRDGQKLVYTETFRDTNVWRLNIALKERERAEPSQLISSQGKNDSAQYSPDGKRIAFVSDRSGAKEIWLCNADGSNPLQLTSSNGVTVGTPRWSPDGRKIVYDSVKDGYTVIYIISTEGGAPTLFASGKANYMMPAWSRDGRYVYFTSHQGAATVWKKPIAGGDGMIVANEGGEVFESLDGDTLYRVKSLGIVQQATTGGPESLVPGLETAQTSRYVSVSNKGIYFLSSERAPWVIQFFDFRTHAISHVATLKRAPEFGTPSLSVSPDDQWMLFSQLDQSGSELMMLENFR